VNVVKRRAGGRAVVAALAIAACLALEIALALVAAAGPSKLVPPSREGFPGYLAGPFQGLLEGAVSGNFRLEVVFVLVLFAMTVAYAVAVAFADALPDRWAVGVACAAAAVMLLSPPLVLTDVFNYVNYARLAVVHDLNPYVYAPSAALQDPVYRLATWHDQPTTYGPLFTLASYPVALLGVGGALWAFKLATAGAAAACTAIVAACARRLGQPPGRAAILLGLNPVLLLYALGGVHNDYFMMLAVLGGLLALLAGRELTAGVALVAGVGVKLAAAPIVPFLMLAAGRGRRIVLGTALAALAMLVVTVAVFGLDLPGLVQQSSSITRYSPVEAIAVVLGQGRYTACPAVALCANDGVRIASAAATTVGLALVAWYGWRTRDWLSAAGWASAVMVLTLTVLMPWYLLWLLPLAILSRSRSLHAVTALLLGYVLVTTQPAAHVVSYAWDHSVGRVLG
jgi:hypothetical protein